MSDVQSAAPAAQPGVLRVAQPSVFDATPAITAGVGVGVMAGVGFSTGVLTRPAGTALHVLQDAEYVMACRSMIGTCTREEWDSPAHRRLAIARAWERAIEALHAEDEELVSFAPLTLYRDAFTGEVRYADIGLPGKPSKLITPDGQRILAIPSDLALGHRRERTTYARWAEGPLPHISLEMRPATTPDNDRDLQYVRNQNAALRELIDAAIGPAEWAPEANDTHVDHGLVDFRIRGVIRRQQLRRIESKQGTGVSGVILGGRVLSATDFEPSTSDELDAVLEAD